jgi:hypothetical protein
VSTHAITVGESYEFVSEVQQEYQPAAKRLRNYTGQTVTVLEDLGRSDPESSRTYKVRAADGHEFTAWEEEISGWDKDLGQFFNPDGTYGPLAEKMIAEKQDEDDAA